MELIKRLPGGKLPKLTCVYCGKTYQGYNSRQYTCGDYECKRRRRQEAARRKFLLEKNTL